MSEKMGTPESVQQNLIGETNRHGNTPEKHPDSPLETNHDGQGENRKTVPCRNSSRRTENSARWDSPTVGNKTRNSE